MRDFLGQTINPGDFLAYPGGGNRTAEYGLLLLKVLEVKSTGLSVERLDASYTSASTGTIVRKKSTITQTTKVVVVKPSERIVEVFEKPQDHFGLVAAWVHGSKPIDW